MTKRLLLIKPDTKEPTEVIPTPEEWASSGYLAKLLECKYFIRAESKMRKIILGDGREIKFNMWVDEDGFINEKKENLLATLIYDPFAELRGPFRLVGNCIMEPYDETPLNPGDWKLIEVALWKNEDLVEKNCVANGIRL